jgi:hypothetical protein
MTEDWSPSERLRMYLNFYLILPLPILLALGLNLYYGILTESDVFNFFKLNFLVGFICSMIEVCFIQLDYEPIFQYEFYISRLKYFEIVLWI